MVKVDSESNTGSFAHAQRTPPQSHIAAAPVALHKSKHAYTMQ